MNYDQNSMNDNIGGTTIGAIKNITKNIGYVPQQMDQIQQMQQMQQMAIMQQQNFDQYQMQAQFNNPNYNQLYNPNQFPQRQQQMETYNQNGKICFNQQNIPNNQQKQVENNENQQRVRFKTPENSESEKYTKHTNMLNLATHINKSLEDFSPSNQDISLSDVEHDDDNYDSDDKPSDDQIIPIWLQEFLIIVLLFYILTNINVKYFISKYTRSYDHPIIYGIILAIFFLILRYLFII